MIKIREATQPYKDEIKNWVKYKATRTPEELAYWTRVWNEDVPKEFICKIYDIQLYYLDGGTIRGLKGQTPVDMDSCLGFNFCRYPWMAENSIGIESILKYTQIQDRNAVIIHEYTEVIEGMLEGMDYLTAHMEKANREEARYRFNPQSSKYYPLLLDLGLENPNEPLDNGVIKTKESVIREDV